MEKHRQLCHFAKSLEESDRRCHRNRTLDFTLLCSVMSQIDCLHSLTQHYVPQGFVNSECSVLGKDWVATVCPGPTEHRQALWSPVMVTPGDRGPFCSTSIQCSVQGGSCHSQLPCGRPANMSPQETGAAATTDNLTACCDWLTEEGRKGGPL